MLVHCGYIGGSGADAAHAVAVDASGNAYIAGETSSTDLSVPDLVGPDLTCNGGESDAFVAKLNPEGTALLYCGYIGGAGKDAAAGLGVDLEGCVYVAGTTDSTEATFPVQTGPDLTYNGGESDAFVAKLNAEGTALVYCGYIGGSGRDMASGIAWGQEGGFMNPLTSDIYIAGSTSSTEATFPVAVGPDLTYNGGESDAFVAKLNADGATLVYCGYVGGADKDEAAALSACPVIFDAVLFVVGRTSSTESSFPVAFGPDLTYNGGESDGFVAKVNSDWTGLSFCGYIGGAGLDAVTDMVADTYYDGNIFPGVVWTYIFLTGCTSSTESSFPLAVGPDLTYNGGETDAFVALLCDEFLPPPSWVYCGYIGGAGADEGTCIDGSRGGLCVAGNTSSAEDTFPAAFGSDLTYNGGASDIFLAKLTSDGKEIGSRGYLGGGGADLAGGMALIPDTQDVLIAGSTDSPETTFPATDGPDLTYNGGAFDAFIARIHMKAPALAALSRTSATFGDPGFALTVSGSDFLEGARVRWTGKKLPTTYVNDKELEAAVAAEDLSGIFLPLNVYVSVENPDHECSGTLDFSVRPGPLVLTSLTPAKAQVGGPGFVLTLSGSGFVPTASTGYGFCGQPVLWNGVSKGSTYVSYNELQLSIEASDIAHGGEIQVLVKDSGTNAGDSNALVFPVSNFTMVPSPSTMAVTAGQSATCAIQLTPQFGSFDSPVTFDCTGLPDKCTASFSPATVTPGAAGAATNLTLKTTAPSTSAAGTAFGSSGPAPLAPAWLLILLLAMLGASAVRAVHGGRPARWLAAAAAVLVLAVLIAACSTSLDRTIPGTPKGTYTVTIKARSGNLTVTNNVTLTVK
ncbi:MAG TPA: SBBP repeat-containing protein [Candidatus Aminicenantes bacterium]|nr:SBBP repeat-containing protein [Candidatus Aminicenantes bacterium]HRY64494.1 SBBP repeat-containing protein [Candidatus Aminicenantes bacterium]HRZ71407.1 SBBP repeat-containing protein [Candidatus Aminicenantes bacterium]